MNKDEQVIGRLYSTRKISPKTPCSVFGKTSSRFRKHRALNNDRAHTPCANASFRHARRYVCMCPVWTDHDDSRPRPDKKMLGPEYFGSTSRRPLIPGRLCRTPTVLVITQPSRQCYAITYVCVQFGQITMIPGPGQTKECFGRNILGRPRDDRLIPGRLCRPPTVLVTTQSSRQRFTINNTGVWRGFVGRKKKKSASAYILRARSSSGEELLIVPSAVLHNGSFQ